MGPLSGIDPTTHHTMNETLLPRSYISLRNKKQLSGSTMKDRSDDPPHHEQMLYHVEEWTVRGFEEH